MNDPCEFMRSGVAAHHWALPFAGQLSVAFTTTDGLAVGSRLQGQAGEIKSTNTNGGSARKASTSVMLKQDPHAGPEPASDPNVI